MAMIYGTPLLLGGGGKVKENDILPYVVTDFQILNQSTGQAPKIQLSWTNPVSVYQEYFAGVKMVRKVGSMPMNTSDGVLVYDGKDNRYTDNDVEYDIDYYYRAFPYNTKGQYQTSLVGQLGHVVSVKGLLLSTIALKEKIKLGRCKNTDLQWQVAHQSGGVTTLVLAGTSVNVVGSMMFDKEEPNNPDSNRKQYGNNRYIHSGIHQWLNAEGAANTWWKKQHNYDVAPPYTNQDGFLRQWSSEHLRVLQNATWTVTKSNTDGGGTETFPARIALASSTEVGLENGTGGEKLAMFNSNADRTMANKWWWLRTPYPSNSCYVRVVNAGGSLYGFSACNTDWVRPLCKISSELLVSLTKDSDGCYNLVL